MNQRGSVLPGYVESILTERRKKKEKEREQKKESVVVGVVRDYVRKIHTN